MVRVYAGDTWFEPPNFTKKTPEEIAQLTAEKLKTQLDNGATDPAHVCILVQYYGPRAAG